MSPGSEPPRSRSEPGRGVIWGALAGLLLVALLIALLGSPVGALIPVGVAAVVLLLFFGGLS